MAVNKGLDVITLTAGADLSTKQFFCVAIATDGQIDPAGAGVAVDGVLQDKPDAAGQAANVAIGGVTKVSAGAAIATMVPCASDAAGQIVAATTGDVVVGKNLEPAGGADEIVSLLLGPSYVLA